MPLVHHKHGSRLACLFLDKGRFSGVVLPPPSSSVGYSKKFITLSSPISFVSRNCCSASSKRPCLPKTLHIACDDGNRSVAHITGRETRNHDIVATNGTESIKGIVAGDRHQIRVSLIQHCNKNGAFYCQRADNANMVVDPSWGALLRWIINRYSVAE
ncbi:hypothetical protein BJX76DRAFT_49011 [Aspergillus varians]